MFHGGFGDVLRGEVDGRWGVTTLRKGFGGATITMFREENQAIFYARDRAYKVGPLYERGTAERRYKVDPDTGERVLVEVIPPKRRPKGSPYYVVSMRVVAGRPEIDRLLYRVLRGSRGARRHRKGGIETETQRATAMEADPAVMIFNNTGVLPGKKDDLDPKSYRWRLNKGLTKSVEDIEERREMERQAKGKQQVSIFDRRGDPDED